MKLGKRLAILGASITLVGLGTAAYATPPWTVSISGAVAYTAATVGSSPQVHFNVPALGYTCTSGTIEGDVTVGTINGQLGTITDSEFIGCLGPLGMPLPLTQNANWSIWATGDPVNGTTPAEIRDIDATVANPDGLCTFDVTGSVSGTFNNANQQLAITGPSTLVVSNVVGCFGLFSESDPLTLTAVYQLDNSIGPLSIS